MPVATLIRWVLGGGLPWVIAGALLAGCGGGGGGGSAPSPAPNPGPSPSPSPTPAPRSGVFIDAAVQGLGYQSASSSGLTDADGRFQFGAGETVTFTLGRTTLGSVAGADVLTPLALFRTSDDTDRRVVNLARLLQSLDADGLPENGITLDAAARSAADAVGPLNLDQPVAVFAADAQVGALLQAARGAGAGLVTTERALGHLRDATFRYRYPGIWRVTFTDGSGEFAIDDLGRARGAAMYQGKTYPLMGYVAGNGGVAIYAADPTLDLVLQYPTAIVTVGRFSGRLVDDGNASGRLQIGLPPSVTDLGAWTAVRTAPTFNLGLPANLAAVIDRFHATMPSAMRFETVSEERRAGPNAELLSDWFLAQGAACNLRRVARGDPPTPLPSLADLRVLDSVRLRGIYRQGRSVIRALQASATIDRAVSCQIRITPLAETAFWSSDPDDTLLTPVLNNPLPMPPGSPTFPMLLPPQFGIDSGEFSGAIGDAGGRPCLYSPLTDGQVAGGRALQGRNCTLTFNGMVVVYRSLLATLRREGEGGAQVADPDDPSNTVTTTTSISVLVDPTGVDAVADDEVTPPVLRPR